MMNSVWRTQILTCEKEYEIKMTVARSHRNAHRASRVWRTWQVKTPCLRCAFVENFSNALRAQDNLSKLLTVLSAIAAPSACTLQNLCTFLVRVPALGAVMVESAVSRLTRAQWMWWGRQRDSTNGCYSCYWCLPRVKSAANAGSIAVWPCNCPFKYLSL